MWGIEDRNNIRLQQHGSYLRLIQRFPSGGPSGGRPRWEDIAQDTNVLVAVCTPECCGGPDVPGLSTNRR
jgi:hypothetical protein